MANVIIFGLQDYAELAHFYLEHDSAHRVAAFCVNRDYVPAGGTYKGLPVVAFEVDPGSETLSELRLVLDAGGQPVSETLLNRWTW